MNKRLSHFGVLLFTILGHSCAPQKSNESELQHNFGETFVKRTSPLKSCKSWAKSQESAETQFAKKYVEKMIDYIIERNNKSSKVFTGFLSRDKFCVGIEKRASENASASSKDGSISVDAGLFMIAQSDDLLAGVLAHELAHVTLNSLTVEHTFSAKLSESELLQFRTSRAQLDGLYDKAVEAEDKLSDAFPGSEKLFPVGKNITRSEKFRTAVEGKAGSDICKTNCANFRKLADEVILHWKNFENAEGFMQKILLKHYTPEEIANKDESDADEVGLEFLARADINLENFWGYDLLMAKKYDNISSCDGLVKRGTAKHPTSCWRVQNGIQEVEKHRAEYGAFLKNKSKNFISNPSLLDVKKEIAILLKSKEKQSTFPEMQGSAAENVIKEQPEVLKHSMTSSLLCQSRMHSITPFRYTLSSDLRLVVYGDKSKVVADLLVKKGNGEQIKTGQKSIEILYEAESGTGNSVFIYRPSGREDVLLMHESYGDGVPLDCKI